MKRLDEMTDIERWELFPIILEKYNSNWPLEYQKTSKAILNSLSEQIERINHFGSTSVPGLIAKPTIDILIEVKQDFDKEIFKHKMHELGFMIIREETEPYYNMYFVKGYTEKGFVGQVYHIHVRYLDDWGELYFRDYLRKHKDVANKYVCLKMALKEKYEHHRDNYTDAKTDFVKHYTDLARDLYENRYKKQE